MSVSRLPLQPIGPHSWANVRLCLRGAGVSKRPALAFAGRRKFHFSYSIDGRLEIVDALRPRTEVTKDSNIKDPEGRVDIVLDRIITFRRWCDLNSVGSQRGRMSAFK